MVRYFVIVILLVQWDQIWSTLIHKKIHFITRITWHTLGVKTTPIYLLISMFVYSIWMNERMVSTEGTVLIVLMFSVFQFGIYIT